MARIREAAAIDVEIVLLSLRDKAKDIHTKDKQWNINGPRELVPVEMKAFDSEIRDPNYMSNHFFNRYYTSQGFDKLIALPVDFLRSTETTASLKFLLSRFNFMDNDESLSLDGKLPLQGTV